MSKSKFGKIIGGFHDLRNWKQIVKDNEEAEKAFKECRGNSCSFHDNRLNRALVNH